MNQSPAAMKVVGRNENGDDLSHLLEDLRLGSEPTFPHGGNGRSQHFVGGTSRVISKSPYFHLGPI